MSLSDIHRCARSSIFVSYMTDSLITSKVLFKNKGIMLDMGEGFDVELAELTDIEQLNVCQVIIDAAKDNCIEL